MEDLDGPPVDWETNAALFGGREEMGQRFFLRFVELTEPVMGALQDAISRNDLEDVRRLAHQIKGGSGSVAATHVHYYAAGLEAAVEGGQTSDVPVQMERLAEAWNHVLQYAAASR